MLARLAELLKKKAITVIGLVAVVLVRGLYWSGGWKSKPRLVKTLRKLFH